MKRILAATLALGLSVAALAGVPAQAAGKTFTLGVIGGVADWQASSAQYANLGPFYQAVYATLLVQSPDGKTLTPGLATSWTYNKAQTQLTLKLRTGQKFTDGEAFNAAAVKKNIDFYATGAASDATTKTAAIASTVAKDASTVVFNLKYPSSTFLTYLSSTLALMQAPNTIGTADAKSTPVGSGPYVFDKANSVSGSSYAFTANPGYWDAKHVTYSNLVIKVIADSTAAVNALKAGQVDAMPVLDPTAVDSLKSAGISVGTQMLNWIGMVFVDKGGRMGSPFAKVAVRQAINYGIDRVAALKVFANNYGETTEQVFAKYNVGYDAALNNTYTYDLAKAKKMLADAGYPDGFSFTMGTFAGTPATQVAFIVDQFKAMGITVNIDVNATVAGMFANMWAPKYSAFRMTLQRDSNSLQLIDFLFDRNAAWNPSGYGDATSDKLIATARTTTGAAQVAALKALNKYTVQQAWFAPLASPQVLFGYNPTKVNVKIHAGNSMPYLLDMTAK